MSSSFNSDFYITSAAAIPLFYLAAFVQEGNLISDTAGLIKNGIASTRELAKSWLASMLTYLKDRGKPGIRGIAFKCCLIAAGLIPFLLTLFIPFILATVGFLLLAAVFVGVLSEGISIWALFYQSDNLPLREIVLWAMLGLLVLMSVRPAVQVMKDLSWSPIFSRGPATQAAPDVVGGRSGDASEQTGDPAWSKTPASPCGTGALPGIRGTVHAQATVFTAGLARHGSGGLSDDCG